MSMGFDTTKFTGFFQFNAQQGILSRVCRSNVICQMPPVKNHTSHQICLDNLSLVSPIVNI